MTFKETSYTSQWLRAMIEVNNVREPMLDVCCTGSVYAQYLPEHTGIDLTPNSVTLENQTFKVMDALEMKFDDGQFNTVLAHNVLSYVGYAAYGHEKFPHGPERLILECLRVTAPGGYFMLTCPVGNSETVKGPMGTVKNFSLAEYRALVYGGDVINETFYIREPSRYKRVNANQVAGHVHNGYTAGAVACVVIKRNPEVEIPSLEDFASRTVEVPDEAEPLAPQLEPFDDNADLHSKQIQKARLLGEAEPEE